MISQEDVAEALILAIVILILIFINKLYRVTGHKYLLILHGLFIYFAVQLVLARRKNYHIF